SLYDYVDHRDLPSFPTRRSSDLKLSHEPLSGVYSGMTPWANSQVTIELLRCPARLSQIRIKRSGGSGRCGRCPNQVAQSAAAGRSEEHTSELQSRFDLVCRLLLE